MNPSWGSLRAWHVSCLAGILVLIGGIGLLVEEKIDGLFCTYTGVLFIAISLWRRNKENAGETIAGYPRWYYGVLAAITLPQGAFWIYNGSTVVGCMFVISGICALFAAIFLKDEEDDDKGGGDNPPPPEGPKPPGRRKTRVRWRNWRKERRLQGHR